MPAVRATMAGANRPLTLSCESIGDRSHILGRKEDRRGNTTGTRGIDREGKECLHPFNLLTGEKSRLDREKMLLDCQ
jgi:hypothetical protein